jgi:protein-disulfide isomerase
MCADEQGKFWEMHDLLFREQRALSVGELKEKAQRLGLDTNKFNAALDSGKYAATVAADAKAGADAGVTGTPAMFVNGRAISGAVPYEMIAEVVDDELQRKGL